MPGGWAAGYHERFEYASIWDAAAAVAGSWQDFAGTPFTSDSAYFHNYEDSTSYFEIWDVACEE